MRVACPLSPHLWRVVTGGKPDQAYKLVMVVTLILTSKSLKKTNVSAQFTKSIHDKLCSNWKLKCRQVATLWTSDLTQLEFSLAVGVLSG